MFLSLTNLTITYTHNNQIIQIQRTNHESDTEFLQIQDEAEFPKEHATTAVSSPQKRPGKKIKSSCKENETKKNKTSEEAIN